MAHQNPLEKLIQDMGLYAGQAVGVSANMLTVALADIINKEPVLRLGGKVSISSLKAQSAANQDWYIALFLSMESEGLRGKEITSEGKTRDTPVEELLVENPNWRSDGLTETVDHLRKQPAFAAAQALVYSELMRLDAPTMQASQRSSPRL
jgi:hypothetical protein